MLTCTSSRMPKAPHVLVASPKALPYSRYSSSVVAMITTGRFAGGSGASPRTRIAAT